MKNGKRVGRPKFKSKKHSRPAFYLANDQCELGDHRIWIPNLGWVNMAENLRFKGKATGVRITRIAEWWFASITVELPGNLEYGRGIREPSLPQNGTPV